MAAYFPATWSFPSVWVLPWLTLAHVCSHGDSLGNLLRRLLTVSPHLPLLVVSPVSLSFFWPLWLSSTSFLCWGTEVLSCQVFSVHCLSTCVHLPDGYVMSASGFSQNAWQHSGKWVLPCSRMSFSSLYVWIILYLNFKLQHFTATMQDWPCQWWEGQLQD